MRRREILWCNFIFNTNSLSNYSIVRSHLLHKALKEKWNTQKLNIALFIFIALCSNLVVELILIMNWGYFEVQYKKKLRLSIWWVSFFIHIAQEQRKDPKGRCTFLKTTQIVNRKFMCYIFCNFTVMNHKKGIKKRK